MIQAVYLFRSGKIPIKNAPLGKIPRLFVTIFFTMKSSLKFEDALIDLGIIETFVEIMRANSINLEITKEILHILGVLLK